MKIMMSGIAAHIRDLDQECREAERDLEDFRDLYQRRVESWNVEINELVSRVQKDKAALKEQLEKKQVYVKRKQEEVQSFRDALNSGNAPSVMSTTTAVDSSRPSTLSELAQTTVTSVEEPATGTFAAINHHEVTDSPKPAIKHSIHNGIPAMSSINKYFPDLPIIVRAPAGNWVEVRCFVCGGNHIEKKGWLRGLRGMLAHVTKSHNVVTVDETRLDSVNILPYCTVRELTDDEAQAIADGNAKVDMINCREKVHNGDWKFVKPPGAQAFAQMNGVEKEAESMNDVEMASLPAAASMRPDDWLSKYPTIVLTRANKWVELRCDICGGNSLANSDRRFAQGLIGFVRHLSRGHGIKPEGSNKRLDWALDRCTYKVLTDDEINSLADDPQTPYAPPKVPFKQTDESGLNDSFRESVGSTGPAANESPIPERTAKSARSAPAAVPTSAVTDLEEGIPTTKRRLSKRSLAALDLTDESEPELSEEQEPEAADSDFNPDGTGGGTNSRPATKRARHSLASFTPKVSTRKRGSKATTSHSVPPSPISPTGAFLDKFCPCSVNGHTCQDGSCKRQKICGRANHDESCAKLSHETRPTCVMGLLGTECPDGDQCSRGHDMIEDRMKRGHHDCRNHSN